MASSKAGSNWRASGFKEDVVVFDTVVRQDASQQDLLRLLDYMRNGATRPAWERDCWDYVCCSINV